VKALAALAACACALAASAQQLQAHLLIVADPLDAETWIKRPAGERGGDASRLRVVPAGQRVHFPIVASGVQAPARGTMELVGDIEFFAPDGQSIAAAKSCCRAVIRDNAEVRTIALGPTAYLQLNPGDMQGLYKVQATVNDGARTASAVEFFRFGDEAPGARPAGGAPLLNMSEPAHRPAAQDHDKRDCLSRPTPAEVIRCTEGR
jgi:hypothetical protein